MVSTVINKVTPQQFRQYHFQARTDLRKFDPPAIAGAMANVQQLAGIRGPVHDLMDVCYWDNFEHRPSHYVQIEVAIRLLFPQTGQREIAGVQLASNYGPYVHYLREARGLRGIVGLDNDPLALRYAAQSGIPVLSGSAEKLPFDDQSLDLVFSRCFLDFCYLNSYSMIERILGEVERCLKPGGAFISLAEEMSQEPGVVGLGREAKFAPEVQASCTGWKDLKIFIKI